MSIRIIQGDVREELPKLPADYFDCVVTSPPYYGLRDYGCDGQIGLEATLDEYLETMVAVCRQLRRVLKPSGVFFLNCGDSYNAYNGGAGPSSKLSRGAQTTQRPKLTTGFGLQEKSLKPKDLMLVPERLGISLQADGWFVRSHIIWAKPNPMPESVTDRPTNAHETIWMLTKASRYFWDAEAVAVEAKDWSTGGPGKGIKKTFHYGQDNGGNCGLSKLAAKYKSDEQPRSRNLRNVWSIASHPFPGAHFATFPPELVERCIKAGSSERGCCPACGAPLVRVTERIAGDTEAWMRPKKTAGMWDKTSTIGLSGQNEWAKRGTKFIHNGWQPSCKCAAANTVPARILDPFAGAGTTGLVADRLGRDCTLIDLNTSYIDMAVNRIRDDAPLFAEVTAG